MKQVISGIIMASCLVSAPVRADVIMPAPQELVTLSIQQRMAMYQSMQALPPKQREANLDALRQEIESLTPQQKQEMSDHFKNEFKSLPPDQQEILKQQLTATQGK